MRKSSIVNALISVHVPHLEAHRGRVGLCSHGGQPAFGNILPLREGFPVFASQTHLDDEVLLPRPESLFPDRHGEGLAIRPAIQDVSLLVLDDKVVALSRGEGELDRLGRVPQRQSGGLLAGADNGRRPSVQTGPVHLAGRDGDEGRSYICLVMGRPISVGTNRHR